MSSGRVALGPTEFSARQNKAWRFCLKPCVCIDVNWEGKRGKRESERDGEGKRGREGRRKKRGKKREKREGDEIELISVNTPV